ncbi:hypothetical protein [Terribacillus sp. AE2B 122]|nr:hypothetical protein [Terribacillus sp. AE2B 122]
MPDSLIQQESVLCSTLHLIHHRSIRNIKGKCVAILEYKGCSLMRGGFNPLDVGMRNPGASMGEW